MPYRGPTGSRLRIKKRMSLTSIFPAILICFLMPLFSAYLDYVDLSDVDFPSRDRSFENPDQVDLFVAQNETRLFVSGFFPVLLRPGIDLLEQFFHSTFQTPSFGQETTILRC